MYNIRSVTLTFPTHIPVLAFDSSQTATLGHNAWKPLGVHSEHQNLFIIQWMEHAAVHSGELP
jgi:hypothetical protein